MSIQYFNAALALGWLLIVSGLAMWSVPLALTVGGLLVLAITLLLAFRAGVVPPNRPGEGS
jgi:hypothetical protein